MATIAAPTFVYQFSDWLVVLAETELSEENYLL